MAYIGYTGGIAIGEIIVYLPALAIAILLVFRHGFGRNSGWIYLVVFTLLRIVGACFQLALQNDPANQALNTGTSILNTVGLSPLLLCALGLLSRVISSINRFFPTYISPRLMRLGQLVVTVGFILAIIGGINSSTQYANDLRTQEQNPSMTPGAVRPVIQPLSKVAIGLFIAGYLILLVSTLVISFSVSHAEDSEKRLLLAVALSLPFIFVRLLYSAISALGSSVDFRYDTTNLLCMAFLMELAVVIIFEAIGITLRQVPITVEAYNENSNGVPRRKPDRWGGIPRTLQERTLIGRLIEKLVKGGGDIEMQR